MIVGSLPAPGGDSPMATAGALTVLNADGHVVDTITAPDINGPWDMTATEHGQQRHPVRDQRAQRHGGGGRQGRQPGNRGPASACASTTVGPQVTSNTVIGAGFAEHTDPNALVVGPTGVGLGRHGTLYVADSNGNRVAAIPSAATRTTAVATAA